MKQVKGFTKEYYIEKCKDDGGVPILYSNMQEAVKALCEYSRTREYDDFKLSEEKAEAGIKRSSNGDWILMDDGSVLLLSPQLCPTLVSTRLSMSKVSV